MKIKTSSNYLRSLLMLIAFVAFSTFHAQAQFFKNLKNQISQSVQQTAANHAANDAGNATDSTIDKSERAIGSVVKKNKNDNSNNNNQQVNTSSDTQTPTVTNTGSTDAASSGEITPTIINYANYDFVPGDTIIFQSQLSDESPGEIPSQFTLENGQIDVQVEDGENVIHVPKGAGATFTARMTKQNYMPDQFTVEFDFKNESFGMNHVMVDFGHRVYYSGGEGILPGMTFGSSSINWTLGDVDYPDGLDVKNPMTWHHVAIAINKNVGKVYIDQYRIVNVNNLTGKPNNVTIDVNGYENSYIKNIRIAAGGIDIYKQKTTPAKIIMHGILFDVDKATLQPQSMGSLNEILNLMKRDPSLKFEIDGHTDNTGDSAHNLTLSQQRADAVKTQLVSMGIDASRLTTKGYGDTKPIDTNDTPEGRANNRRVEFVKM